MTGALPSLGGLIRQLQNAKLVNVLFAGSTSGTTSLQAPAVAGTGTVITLPSVTGTLPVSTGVGLGQSAVCTGAFSATSNTTLANVTGMSVNLVAGATYIIDIYLAGTAGASGGIKVSLGGGTATATSFAADSWLYNGTTVAGQTQSTTYSGNQVATTAAFTTCFITGTIVVNAGGTFVVQAAQNASNGTATTIAVNSNMTLTRVS